MNWQVLQWAGWGNPAWLGALGLLGVPIAIHLLSRGRQRRVAIGSIRWLAPAETARARRVRPSRWWLLALRCLILALVAAALAAPQLKLWAASAPRSWALVSPVVAAERQRLEPLNREAYARLDHLLTAGSTVRWLAPGVPAGTLDDPPPAAGADSWSLIQEASRDAPPATTFEVFALDRAEDLRGVRPALDRAVAWNAVVDPEPNRWIERALPLTEGRLAVYVGTSDPGGTRYERFETGSPAGRTGAASIQESDGQVEDGPAGLTVESGPEGRRVTLASGGTVVTDDAVVVPDTPPADVAILSAPERAEDASYVRAAIEALRDSGAVALGAVRGVEIGRVDLDEQITIAKTAQVVFWLSPEPVPAALRESRRAGGVLVSDALDRFEECDCAVSISPSESAVRFDRRGDVEPGAAAGVALWEDERLGALLDAQRVGAGSWLRLHARFHPAWTDLVLSSAFPAWLLDVVRVVSPVVSARLPASDRRSAPGEGAPREQVAAPSGETEENSRESERWLWLGVFGLLACERRLAVGRAQ